MSIKFGRDSITLTEETYSFLDIYNACYDGSVKKIDDHTFLIKKSLFIGTLNSQAILKDKNVSVTISDKYFQVYKGSKLILGEIDDNGATENGCFISMPNVEPIYGFGYGADIGNGRHPENAGDFYAYNSTIKAYGFWAWFSGEEQRVEIIDCIINGFGRIQGEDSIVKNVIMERSHSKYGILGVKGEIKEFSNVTCKLPGNNNEWSHISTNHKVYHNPKFAPKIRISDSVLFGYDKLVYTEKDINNSSPVLTFVDCDILNGYERTTKDSNSKVMICNTFNPILYNSNGDILEYTKVKIKNGKDEVVFDDETNLHGEIYTELVVKRIIGDYTAKVEDLNPFTTIVSINNNGSNIDVENTFTLFKKVEKSPFFIHIKESYCDNLENKINNLTNLANIINHKIDDIETNDLEQTDAIIELSNGWRAIT